MRKNNFIEQLVEPLFFYDSLGVLRELLFFEGVTWELLHAFVENLLSE